MNPGPLSESGLTLRALVWGLLLSAFACAVVSWAELYIGQIQIAILQFAPSAVGILVVLALANVLLRNLSGRWALRPAETISIYAMVLVASLATSRGILEKWIPALVASNYYATPANRWEGLFPHLPQWAVPWNVNGGPVQPIARWFYEGLDPGQELPWRAWVGPLASWSIPVLLVVFFSLCLAAVLRRQWADNEKLAFPLTILPLELAEDQAGPRSFFRNRLVWLGAAVPTVIYILNNLHANYPGVQQIALTYDLGPAFAGLGKPWSDFGGAILVFSMGALGFFYFLPTELLFSLWFFFWFVRLENIVFSALGQSYEGMPMYPTAIWNGYQIAGAFFVVVGYMIKSSWPYLRRVWEQTRQPGHEAEPELLPLRWALLGAPVAAVGMGVWMWKLGMTPSIAALQVGVYLLVTIPVMARSVNEAGLLETETSFRPIDLARMFTPLQTLGPRTLSALSLTDAVFMRDQRGNLLSAFLDLLKLAGATGLRRRSLLIALVLGLVVALVVGGILGLLMPYRLGAIQMYTYVYQGTPNWVAGYYAGLLQSEPRADGRLLPFFLSGVAITLACAILRMRFLWWPLAPIGMALSGVYSLRVFWFALLLAWVIKTAVMRYGGMKTFQALRPFFLGLILGEFTQAVIWTVICGVWRLQAAYFSFG